MLFKLLKSYSRTYWKQFTAVIILQLISVITSLYLPSLNADIIDKGVAQGDIGYIWQTGTVMLVVTLLQIFAAVAAVWFAAQAAMAIGRDIRRDLFRHVNLFSEQELSRFGAPSLITRNTNDVQQVQMLVLMFSTLLVQTPIMGVGGVIMAIRQDVGLSWLIAVSVPLLLVILAFIAVRMVPLFRVLQEQIDAINRVMREQLTGIRVVRAFVKEKAEKQRFTQKNEDLTNTGLTVGRLFVLLFPLVMLVLNASSVAVIWFGGHRVNEGDIQIGTLTAFLAYLMQILMAVLMATFMIVMIPRASVCAERISEVLHTVPAIRDPQESISDFDATAGVELLDVSFQYPGADAPVLNNISFHAEAGKTTAIIGSTGSGKSTLVNLIPRLIEATSGMIFVGGVNVTATSLENLWSQIGLVPQKAFLFSGTVASNLRVGKPDASDEELWRALEIAQAGSFVQDMGKGLDSRISQGGTNVSGGQRQRLAIARALVKNPAVLVFDDSFSALDVRTDAALRAALNLQIKNAAKIVVAQRVATVRDADQIIVLDQERIVGQGSHEELLQTCETYRQIVDSQLSVEEAL